MLTQGRGGGKKVGWVGMGVHALLWKFNHLPIFLIRLIPISGLRGSARVTPWMSCQFIAGPLEVQHQK